MTTLHRLDEICELLMGQAPDGEAYNFDGKGWPLIAGAGDFGETGPAPKKFTTQASKLSQSGDIVLGIRASIGEKVLSDGVYCLGRGVAALRPRPALDGRYLWHWLTQVIPELVSKAKGATFKQVNRDDIGELNIPLPALPEQRRIAAILDQADALQAKRHAALAQLDTLTQSVFLDLFGDPSSNPRKWPEERLETFFHFQTGKLDSMIDIAGLLEEKASIPMVQQQLELIQEIQNEEFWQDVTTPILENVRKRLRSLVKLTEKGKRITVYTDFQDILGDEAAVDLPGFGTGADFEKFRAKARQFLKAHEDHPAIIKLRFNERLTSADVKELEKMLLQAGAGTAAEINRAKDENYKLGLFFRSLIGLDREAAKRAFANFLLGKTPTANQIEFINLMIDYLTQRGWMDPSILYESPFTDISARGVEGVFDGNEVTQLLSVLTSIREHAAV